MATDGTNEQPEFVFSETLVIGDNDHYKFGVGLCGDRWCGFALGEPEDNNRMLFVFPGVAQDFQLGLPDRDKAILMTGAIAQEPDSMYGGILRWFVQDDLRGDPNTIERCQDCGEIGCQGDCSFFDPFADEGDA
jgi:hypothetical protein